MKNYTLQASFDDSIPYEEENGSDRIFDTDDYSGAAVSEEDAYGFYPDTSF